MLDNRTKKDQKNAWTKLHVCLFIFLVKRFLLNFLVLFVKGMLVLHETKNLAFSKHHL